MSHNVIYAFGGCGAARQQCSVLQVKIIQANSCSMKLMKFFWSEWKRNLCQVAQSRSPFRAYNLIHCFPCAYNTNTRITQKRFLGFIHSLKEWHITEWNIENTYPALTNRNNNQYRYGFAHLFLLIRFRRRNDKWDRDIASASGGSVRFLNTKMYLYLYLFLRSKPVHSIVTKYICTLN